MRREMRTYLLDVLEACERIQTFVAGKDFLDYERDALLRSAVERQFGIIGDALFHAIRREPELAQHISGTHHINEFRNRLVHGFVPASNALVWGVLESRLPRLKREVETLLREHGDVGRD